MSDHESFIRSIRDIVAARIETANPAAAAALRGAKVCYGTGMPGTRGVTYYSAWQNGDAPSDKHAFIEVCAGREESITQVIGTTIHECGHVIAGNKAGHGSEWKAACAAAGLVTAQAGGQAYTVGDFDGGVWNAVKELPEPRDGKPLFKTLGTIGGIGLGAVKIKPCPLGIGTKGGKSRGPGSGSRLVRVSCPTDGCGFVIRMTRTWIDREGYGTPDCPAHKVRMIADQG